MWAMGARAEKAMPRKKRIRRCWERGMESQRRKEEGMRKRKRRRFCGSTYFVVAMIEPSLKGKDRACYLKK